jgi:DNA polymerase III gamma/tau subunit
MAGRGAEQERMPLINRYRPDSWDTIIGHEEIMRALQRSLDSDSAPAAFLFSGPAGIGKTSTARIVAGNANAEVIEIDAASHSGVDDMRELVNLGSHMALSGEGMRAIIIDECHALSKAAWQAVLKILEEPPSHLMIILCTTELAKVPESIRTRCFHVALKPLRNADIEMLVEIVAGAEGWTVANDVMEAVVIAATGQPRKALSLLQAVHDCEDREEVKRIIALNETTDDMLELFRAIVGRKPWGLVRGMLERIEDDAWESASVAGSRYIMSVLVKTEDELQAQRIWKLLDALTFPSETYDRKAHFYAALGRMLWSD